MELTSVTGALKGFPPWLLLFAGGVIGWLKSFWSFFYSHTILVIEKKIKVELTIEEQDHKSAFTFVNKWTEKQLRKKKISSLRLDKRNSDRENSDGADYEILPGYGFYYFWWHRKLITFESSKKETSGGGYGESNKLIRTITLQIWGTRDRNLLLKVLEEARKDFDVSNPRSTKYYVHKSDYWDDFVMRNRSLDTIYLPNNQLQDILADFEKFYATEDKYRKLGIPYRRGYLFEGPPGSGKTTLVQALASHFKVGVYFVNLSSGLNAVGLSNLLSECVSPCIVLMEDIDCIGAAENRETKDKKKKQDKSLDKSLGIQTNELLNILDGLVATEERVVIMTTNHPENLDKALIRNGRVDRRFHIGYSADEELQRFHRNASEVYPVPEFLEFRKLLPEKCTIADAQSKIFELQNTLDKELEG